MFKTALRYAAVVCLMSTAASAAAPPVLKLVETRDIVALEALSRAAPAADEQRLANGAALALRHKDDAALAALLPLTQSAADKELRVSAYLTLSEVYLRQSRYADAYAAMAAAKALSDEPLDAATLQTMDFVSVLKGVKPMALIHPATGQVPITRYMGSLMRVPVKINGQAQDAVIDSGAGFSAVSESTAKALGLHMLEGAATVASASKDAVPMRIGIADRLEFGDAVLTDVVFIVLPDEALSFVGGLYKIRAIIGLPVFEKLGRLEFAQVDGKEVLYYGPKPGAAAGEPNLLLAGVEPIVLVNAAKATGPLRMFIDTGAWSTTLYAKAMQDYPAMTADAVKVADTLHGAGGETRDENARKLPELRLTIAGREIVLKGVVIHSKDEPDRHGAIGQDVLKQGKSWVIDFVNMCFAVE